MVVGQTCLLGVPKVTQQGKEWVVSFQVTHGGDSHENNACLPDGRKSSFLARVQHMKHLGIQALKGCVVQGKKKGPYHLDQLSLSPN